VGLAFDVKRDVLVCGSSWRKESTEEENPSWLFSLRFLIYKRSDLASYFIQFFSVVSSTPKSSLDNLPQLTINMSFSHHSTEFLGIFLQIKMLALF
jgi:hypothetical protein